VYVHRVEIYAHKFSTFEAHFKGPILQNLKPNMKAPNHPSPGAKTRAQPEDKKIRPNPFPLALKTGGQQLALVKFIKLVLKGSFNHVIILESDSQSEHCVTHV
jgi:hypothetical protein